MNKFIYTLLIPIVTIQSIALAHCQVPCGIYDDALYIVQIKEDYKTIKKASKKNLKVIVEYNGPIEAPITKDQEIGILKIYYKTDLLDQYKIYASSDVKKVNLFSRLFKSINYLIWGDV